MLLTFVMHLIIFEIYFSFRFYHYSLNQYKPLCMGIWEAVFFHTFDNDNYYFLIRDVELFFQYNTSSE